MIILIAHLGVIPTSLWYLPRLNFLDLSDNSLSGIIPQFRSDSVLKDIDLGNNIFCSSIPSNINELQYIRTLFMDNNRLVGTLPKSMCSCTTLEDVSLMNNALSGSVSACLNNLTELTSLRIQNNLFEGPLKLNTFKYLNLIDLSSNRLSGISLFSILGKLSFF